jgi:urease accessory protein
MRSAREIKPAGQWRAAAIDRVVLNADDRHRRRVVLTGERGTRFLLDLPHATVLQDGDGLVLDDGSIVCVSSGVEPLAEIEGYSDRDLIRLAWHLGNRHAVVEILGNKLRIRRDHVLEDMVVGLGGLVTDVQAAFEPEISGPGHHGHHRGDAKGDAAHRHVRERTPRQSD